MKRTDETSQTASWRGYLDAAATLAVIVVSIAVTWGVLSGRLQPRTGAEKTAAARNAAPALPVQPIRLGQGPIKGSKTAKVAVIEYTDFQCPYCARFAQDTLPALDRKYVQTGKVMFAFQHLPLRTHTSARSAAEGAECANRQGRFWEMHDLLFAKQKQLDAALIIDSAQRVGVNAEIFAYCLDGEAAPFVKEQADAAVALGVTGTPTFFIGTVLPGGVVKVARRFSGAQPLETFEEALETLLQTPVAERK